MKKVLAIILVCMMSLSVVTSAATFVDVEGHWAAPAIENAAKNSLVTGNNGRFNPNNNMTRAEMATIMARACGATEMADISAFTDMNPEDWTYASMSKAVAMGAFNGSDNKLNPNNPITRQEAFVVLSRVFGLAINEAVDVSVLDQFKDVADIAEWAQKDIAAIVASGYVGGNDGKLNPNANITRAEFAVVMDRLIKYYIDEAVTTIPTDGNVMIRVEGLNLDGVETDKMVVIGDGVGSSEMSIINSRFDGVTLVRSGKVIRLDGRYANLKIIRPNIRVEGEVRMVGDPEDVDKILKGYVTKGSTLSNVVNLGTPAESDEQ